MRLLQLTGEAKCQGYVAFSLYFHSQLGYVRLRNVEAYVLKDLTVPLLIGEDIQTPWQLHTLRRENRVSWQVGDSEHQIPLCNRQDHSDAYLSVQETVHLEKSRPSGTGRIRTAQDEIIAAGSVKFVQVQGVYDERTGTRWIESYSAPHAEPSYLTGPDSLVNVQ